MNRKNKIKILVILFLFLLILFIYVPKPLRFYVKKNDIEQIEYVAGPKKRYYGIISEDNYDDLFKMINKSFVVTNLLNYKRMSAEKVTIYYADGNSVFFSSTHTTLCHQPIYTITFDFSVCESLIQEKIDYGSIDSKYDINGDLIS